MEEADYIAAEFDACAHDIITERESYELGQREYHNPENTGKTAQWVMSHKYRDERGIYHVWMTAFTNGYEHALHNYNIYVTDRE